MWEPNICLIWQVNSDCNFHNPTKQTFVMQTQRGRQAWSSGSCSKTPGAPTSLRHWLAPCGLPKRGRSLRFRGSCYCKGSTITLKLSCSLSDTSHSARCGGEGSALSISGSCESFQILIFSNNMSSDQSPNFIKVALVNHWLWLVDSISMDCVSVRAQPLGMVTI